MSPRISEQARKRQQEEVLHAASRCLARSGYVSFTVDEVALEANMSKGAVYTYFGGKDEIIIELAKFILDRKFAEIRSVCLTNDLAFNKILELWMLTVKSWAEIDCDTRAIFEMTAHRSLSNRIEKMLHFRFQFIEGAYRDLIEQGIRSTEFHPVCSSGTLAQMLWSQTDGLIRYWIIRNRKATESELMEIQTAFSHTLRGVLGFSI